MTELLLFDWLKELSNWGETSDGTTRLAFSSEEKEARQYLINLMNQYGMEVTIDEAANVIGRYPSIEGSDLPVVAIGSHLDSVPCGGKYDGVLGVLSGLEVVRYFYENGIRGKHPVEIIIFSNEEGCRYPYTLFGSSVMMGDFNKSFSEMQEMKDDNGDSFVRALKEAEGKPESLTLARRNPKEFKAFLELHIEQGAVLEKEKKPLGIVEGISAPIRFILKLTGNADHAGATPMYLRRDPLMGAAEIMLALEKIVTGINNTAVGTVGQINIKPGAVNIIPGEANLSFDIRDIDLEARNTIIERLKEEIAKVCQARKLVYELEETFNISPVTLNKEIVNLIGDVCQELQVPALPMISGAGHDAMVMAKHIPTGMIFVPSVGGISHNPDEYTKEEDIITGVKVLREVVRRLIK